MHPTYKFVHLSDLSDKSSVVARMPLIADLASRRANTTGK